jgi:hypothetical protein
MDHLQRDVLIGALEAATEKKGIEARMIKDVLWAAQKIDKLSNLRNDAVHMVTYIDSKKTPPQIMVEPMFTPEARTARIRAMKDMNKIFRHARSDLLQLAGYVGIRAIALLSVDDKPVPLHRRPRLRCHVTKKQA